MFFQFCLKSSHVTVAAAYAVLSLSGGSAGDKQQADDVDDGE